MFFHLGVVCSLGSTFSFTTFSNVLNSLKTYYPAAPLVTTFIANEFQLLTGIECVIATLQLQTALVESDMCLLRSIADAVNLSKQFGNPGAVETGSDAYMCVLAADIIATYVNIGGDYSMWPLQHCSAKIKVFDIYSSLPAAWHKTKLLAAKKTRVVSSGGYAPSTKSDQEVTTKKSCQEMASALHCRYLSSFSGTSERDEAAIIGMSACSHIICNHVCVVDICLKSNKTDCSLQYRQFGTSQMASTFVWATPKIAYPVLYNSTAGATQCLSALQCCSTVSAEDVAHMHRYYSSLCANQRNVTVPKSASTSALVPTIVACCLESPITKQVLQVIVQKARHVIRAGAYVDR